MTAPANSGDPPDQQPLDSTPEKELPPLQPTLNAYYSAEKVRPADWLKAIKLSKVSVFSSMDLDATLGSISSLDPVLQKTLQLADAGNAPVIVHRWVDRVTRARLAILIGDDAENLITDETRVGRLLRAKDFGLRAKDQNQRRYAENLLRLVIAQHLESREILLGPILLLLDERLPNPEKEGIRDRNREVGEKLFKGSLATAAAMAATYGLAHMQTESVRAERDRLRVENGRQQRVLGERQAEINRLIRLQADGEQKIGELTGEIADLQRRHSEQTQVVHHGVAELRTDVRAFLEGRLQPLLSDALDGVEIALSEIGSKSLALNVAGDRLRALQAALKEEIEWLQSSG